MFQTRLLLNNEGSAAAPAAAPTSSAAPSVNTSSTSPVISTADLFKGIEDKYINNVADEDDVMNSDQYSDSEDIDNPSDDTVVNPAQEAQPEAEGDDDDLPLYVFKSKVGDDDIELVIENPAQLDHYLKRAAVAPKIYAENQQLKEQQKQLSERAAIADEFERMSKESPTELLNLILEDVPEETLIPWLQTIAAELEETQEYKQRRKEAREVAYIREQWAKQQEREKQLAAQKAQHIEEQNIREIQGWRNNEFTKWSAKVPAEHHDVLKQMIDDQLLYASNMANAGNDVDLTALSSRLYKYVNSIVGSQKTINTKVGKAAQAARQQSTSKLQAATGKFNTAGKPQQSQGGQQFKDPSELFDFLSQKVGRGEIKIKG